MLRLVKYIETEVRIVVLRIWGEKGTDGYCLMGTESQFYKIKSLETDSGDSFTITVAVFNINEPFNNG